MMPSVSAHNALAHLAGLAKADLVMSSPRARRPVRLELNSTPSPSQGEASVMSLTDDSQIGVDLRVYADEEDRADFDQRS